jgi:hypothetical protein
MSDTNCAWSQKVAAYAFGMDCPNNIPPNITMLKIFCPNMGASIRPEPSGFKAQNAHAYISLHKEVPYTLKYQTNNMTNSMQNST